MSGNLKTGIAAVDQYLAKGYDEVQGFSSRFSATICGHLLRRQRELGVRGSVAEVGTFEGRFFIAMGLALGEGSMPMGLICSSGPVVKSSIGFWPTPTSMAWRVTTLHFSR